MNGWEACLVTQHGFLLVWVIVYTVLYLTGIRGESRDGLYRVSLTVHFRDQSLARRETIFMP